MDGAGQVPCGKRIAAVPPSAGASPGPLYLRLCMCAPANPPTPPAGGIDYPDEFRGCYAEGAPRTLPDLLANSSAAMTPTVCRDLALAGGYRLYATQNGALCYGGYVPPADARKAPGGCQLACPGARKAGASTCALQGLCASPLGSGLLKRRLLGRSAVYD